MKLHVVGFPELDGGCYRFWFFTKNGGPEKGLICLVSAQAARSDTYLRSLIDFIEWKLSL